MSAELDIVPLGREPALEPGTIEALDLEGAQVVVLVGEHDLSTALTIETAIVDAFAAGSRVIVDLTRATFIDSTVLRELIRAARYCADSGVGDSVAVVVPPDSYAARVLGVVGLDSVIPTYPTLGEAVQTDADT